MTEQPAGLPEWVASYLAAQQAADPRTAAIRFSAEPGSAPYPDPDNPMLAFLVARARSIAATDGADSALVWLAAHAWYEGHLEGTDPS